MSLSSDDADPKGNEESERRFSNSPSHSVIQSTTGDSQENETRSDHGEEEEELANKETKAVFRLRIVVFLVLLCAAVAVSVAVYFISKKAQDDQFETQFVGSAERIIASFNSIVEQKIAAVGSVALAFTAYASSHNLTWPFVTMQDFPQHAASAMSLSEAVFIAHFIKVTEETRSDWERYVMNHYFEPAMESIDYQQKAGIYPFTADRKPAFLQSREEVVNTHKTFLSLTKYNQSVVDILAAKETLDFTSGVANHIYSWNEETGAEETDSGPGPYFPIYQIAPFTSTGWVNLNVNTPGHYQYKRVERCINDGNIILTGFDAKPPGDILSDYQMTAIYSTWLSFAAGKEVVYTGDPMSNVYVPVFDSFNENRTAVAVVNAAINWKTYFKHILPENIRGVDVVLTNECVGSYTYQVNGADVTGLGMGDLHNPKFDHLEKSLTFQNLTKVSDGTQLGLELNQDGCPYTLRVYPSQTFYDDYSTSGPIVITCCVAITFVFMAAMFLLYDRLVERRQRLVMYKANQSNALVSSLFPKNVRDRLLADNEHDANKSSSFLSANRRVKSFLTEGSEKKSVGEQPIADLFPHATVMFADIAGFTAWSSTRDPSQVFILLQSIYRAFDEIAGRRKVFKVETIGDSYVAVAGLPDPQPNHPVIMARFAWDCVRKMAEVTKDMERTLGPDTGDLQMRFGLHSGPVTAGVLLGDRARFQLFGDTVNTASRMECTGFPSKVQASQATANLLIEAGKKHWITPRTDTVVAKGKGIMNTFWVNPYEERTAGSSKHSSAGSDIDKQNDVLCNTAEAQVKHSRLVDWVVELFLEHIKKVVARHAIKTKRSGDTPRNVGRASSVRPKNHITLDEVAEVISMPTFDSRAVLESEKMIGCVEIAPAVVHQLRSYVATIASAYRDNPFHNFEHACHVTMAVDKFLRRIVAPDLGDDTYKEGDGKIVSHLHDYTHGINSDPLTIFAIVFSALIHDVDHRGVSNIQLIKEEEQMANLYRNKSVAEQNSLDISWDLLMSVDFIDLRACLFPTKADLLRFRQVIVNVVLATDIFDKELNDLRKARWEKAFSEDAKVQNANYNDLRATIVIEHIIQASDVSHTMQHWHVYRKWNARLFKEMSKAFCEGRMGVDPCSFWYKGELGFFDNYIIPLAKKLADCQVFGVSSDECLNYAELNRAEWEQRGEQIMLEMMEEISCEDKHQEEPMEQYQKPVS